MHIHVVSANETLQRIATQYRISPARLASINGIHPRSPLTIGQALAVFTAATVHTAKKGETIPAIAARYGVGVRQIYRRNPALRARPLPDATCRLVIRTDDTPTYPMQTLSIIHPSARRETVCAALPYLTFAAPVCGRLGADIPTSPKSETSTLLRDYDTLPLIGISNLTPRGVFDHSAPHFLLRSAENTAQFTENVLRTVLQQGYAGVFLDIHGILAVDRPLYTAFLQQLRCQFLAADRIVAAVDTDIADGYTVDTVCSPLHPFAPPPCSGTTPPYAPPQGGCMTLPLYGYDWELPFSPCRPAVALTPKHAVELAICHRAPIQYDRTLQLAHFSYCDAANRRHIVWFADPRSAVDRIQTAIQAKCQSVLLRGEISGAIPHLLTLDALCRITE